jgi:hypothetical protein
MRRHEIRVSGGRRRSGAVVGGGAAVGRGGGGVRSAKIWAPFGPDLGLAGRRPLVRPGASLVAEEARRRWQGGGDAMAGLLQLGGEDFTGLVGLGRARRGLVCPCCFVRSAAVKTAGGGRPVEVVPSRR